MFQQEFSTVRRPHRVLLLGASGFIGSRLIRFLSAAGTCYRAVSRSEVDLSRPEAVEKLRLILEPGDSLVVLSALTPEKGRDRPAFLKNVSMIDAVCAAISESSCAHLLYISSDSVYANRSVEIDESSCCESNDLYALGHIVREKLLVEACQSAKIRLIILRPSAIYGAGDTHNSYGPNRFIRTALAEKTITLFGGGEEERDHLYIDDLCRLIQMCLANATSGILNAVNGTALSFREVAREIRTAMDDDVSIQSAPRRIPIVHRRFNTSALTAAFADFRPTPFRVGVRNAIQEMRLVLSIPYQPV
jgi:UDP-glucose 4-epimerase